MHRLGLWLVCIVGLLSACGESSRSAAGKAADPAAPVAVASATAQAPWLRERLPPDTVTYARIPSVWGLVLAPDGRALDAARVHPSFAQAVGAIRQAITVEPALAQGEVALWRLLLGHWAGPAELALVSPNRIPGPGSQVLVSVPTSGFAQVADLANLIRTSGGPPLALDDQGYGAIAESAVHFDVASGRVLVLAGDRVSLQRLKEVEAGLQVSAPAFAATEQDIDRSGQGLFLWVDLVAMRTFIAMGAAQSAELQQFMGELALYGKSFSLGSGTAGAKGRLSYRLEAPDAPLLRYFARETRQYAVATTGKVTHAYALSLLYSPEEYTAFRAALQKDFGDQAVAELDRGLAKAEAHLGFPLPSLLAAVGPDIGGFGDAAGAFWYLRVRDRAALEALLKQLAGVAGVTLEERDGIHAMAFRSLFASGGALARLELVSRWRNHLYWRDEGEYLVFASTPQALLDRRAMGTDGKLLDWLAQSIGPGVAEAALFYAGETRGSARAMYDYTLIALQGAADMSGAQIDAFSFPSARALDLPELGSTSLVLRVSPQGLALNHNYDISPMDSLASGQSSLSSVYIVGVLAAIALPVYQDYIARSQVSEAVASADAAQRAVAEFVVREGRAPRSLSEAGMEADAVRTRYAMVSVRDGQVLVRLHGEAPVSLQVRGAEIALAQRRDGSWACGNVALGVPEAEFLAGNPAQSTTLPYKYLPSRCRR